MNTFDFRYQVPGRGQLRLEIRSTSISKAVDYFRENLVPEARILEIDGIPVKDNGIIYEFSNRLDKK